MWPSPLRSRARTDVLGPIGPTTALLATAGGVLFGTSAVIHYWCGSPLCGSDLVRRLDVEAVGGLPRLFTTAVLLVAGVLAATVTRRSIGRHRIWWATVSLAGLLLAATKVVGAHSALEEFDGRVWTFVGSMVVAVVGLRLLAVGARRWRVVDARPVVIALGACAVATIGLDGLAWMLVATQDVAGGRSHVVLAFIEEYGEALSAIGVLAVVRWARVGSLASVGRSTGS